MDAGGDAVSKGHAARPTRVLIRMHNGGPLDADPNGNRAQRRAAAKLGIKPSVRTDACPHCGHQPCCTTCPGRSS